MITNLTGATALSSGIGAVVRGGIWWGLVGLLVGLGLDLEALHFDAAALFLAQRFQ